MTGLNCYIIGAGERTGPLPVPHLGELLIAADGGYAWVEESGLSPDFIIGDFDSLTVTPAHSHVISLPKEKDETDMMAALHIALERGYQTIHFYGGTGGRIDHTLANFQILSWLSQQGKSGLLYGKGWMATAITDGTLRFDPEERGTISVFAHSDRALGVDLVGLKYPLQNAVLENNFALGVSNEFTGISARITVKHGTLLVIWETLR